AIVMGVFPTLFLKPMEPSVRKTVERVTGRSFAERPGDAIRDSWFAIRQSQNPEIRTANREPRAASTEVTK
ncbi:MAG TPA: hypothetical protein VNR64_11115, partial [Vicinamibacterales bacterium]|nr:hypothetical protein [Vicinamibacterales bacterium]